MTKYVVYSKWFWKDGVPEAAFVQDWLRGRKPNIIATDYVLFKVDNKHHEYTYRLLSFKQRF